MVTREQLAEILPDYKVMGKDGECYEVESFTTAGEDVVITLWGKNLGEMADYARGGYEEFDPEDHAAVIYHAKHYGSDEDKRYYAGAPYSLSDLLEDAKEIKAMHKEIWDKLVEADRKGRDDG